MKIIMIVPQRDVKGGIAAVTEGYYDSRLTREHRITFLESYCDGSKFKKLGKGVGCCFGFLKAVIKERPDLVHVHSSFGPSFFRKMPILVMAGLFGIPVVNHIHGSELDKFYTNAGRLKQALVRRIYRIPARTVVLSEEWKKRLSGIAPADRIMVLRNYARVAEGVPSAESKTSKQVLFLGLINDMKGCGEIPAMVKEVLKEVPDARFVIAGEGEADKLRGSLTEAEQAHVQLPGWIRGEVKEKVLRESAIFLLPSHSEAMPMSILETMGYAMPVVASDVGGIPALVDDGKTGILCPVGDAAAFAKALITYLTDEDRREADGGRGLCKVQENFGLDAHIAKLLTIYEEAAGRKNV